MFGDPTFRRGDLTHAFENVSAMVTLATFVAHPRGHVLDDNQLIPMPEVFTSPLRLPRPTQHRAQISPVKSRGFLRFIYGNNYHKLTGLKKLDDCRHAFSKSKAVPLMRYFGRPMRSLSRLMIFPLRIAASRSAYSNLVCQGNFFR